MMSETVQEFTADVPLEIHLLHLLVLAAVQGITEFLPISSSAHLILVPRLTGWPDQGLAIDVASHMGTLAAVMLYFRRDTLEMLRGSLRILSGDFGREALFAAKIGLATIPVLIAGLILKDTVEAEWRSAVLIGWTSILFGILLFIADRWSGRAQPDSSIGFAKAVLIGIAQAVAIVPGVSRSGVTMTAALFLGSSRTEAARFSLLLSIPVTLAAGVLTGVQYFRTAPDFDQLPAMAFTALVAGLTAWLAIAALMRWLSHATFTPFVIYRVALGIALLALLA